MAVRSNEVTCVSGPVQASIAPGVHETIRFALPTANLDNHVHVRYERAAVAPPGAPQPFALVTREASRPPRRRSLQPRPGGGGDADAAECR